MRLEPSMGYQWIFLDPEALKMGEAPQIFSPDQRGRADRFLEDLSTGIPRD